MKSHMYRPSRFLLAGLAFFAMAWAVGRAIIQSITIDEAFTYVVFVSHGRYWRAASNNHTLNSVLMGLFTRMFGISDLTARLPALIGAALYITATYRLCRLLSQSIVLQAALFSCLVFNPFIFDFLVAARGYGLALGFLMWAIVSMVSWHVEQGPPKSLNAACTVSSACIGLSVASNLAFAFVASVTIAAIILYALSQRKESAVRSIAACVIPGAIVTLIFPAYPILHWPKGEFIYGATSLRDTFGTIVEASLYRTSFDLLEPAVFPLVCLTALIWLAYLFFWPRRHEQDDVRSGWHFRLGMALMVIVIATVGIHWVAFQLFGLLLPKDRTAIYLYSLPVTAVGAFAAIQLPTRLGRYLRTSLIGALVVMAAYFFLCLRLDHFKEWQWDADVKEAYSVLTCLNRAHGVTGIASGWPYFMALNFYRLARHTPIDEILDESSNPPNVQVFVLDTWHNSGVVERRGLSVFYRGRSTDLVIAAAPEFTRNLQLGPCLAG